MNVATMLATETSMEVALNHNDVLWPISAFFALDLLGVT
jgi:hypothetical protein